MLALTLEQRSWLHAVPAGAKMAAVALAVVLVVPVTDPAVIGAMVLGVAALYGSAGAMALRAGLRLLRPLVLMLAIIMAWHLLMGEARLGLVICLRILGLVALANLVTLTTRLDDMMAVLEWLMAPLTRLGLPTGRLALAVALAIRTIPALSLKADALREAWRARATRRPGPQLAFPLVLLALDDATHVAEALRARGGLAATETTKQKRN
ncbi:MAG: energy-coupling factor transporter transmembrane protein EcfT [Pararhodobacter sp.]|nr:energy-coupling factor transporter transmembrane protein EcfT [Pararhodobacter sp.]